MSEKYVPGSARRLVVRALLLASLAGGAALSLAATVPPSAAPSAATSAAPAPVTTTPAPVSPASPAPAGAAGNAEQAAIASVLRPFTAVLAVDWKGINAGYSTLELTRNGNDRWTYSSRSEARGLAKLFVPGDITQTSQFTVVNGDVQPLKFRGDDGTSDDSRDISLDFDWPHNRVTGVAERRKVQLDLRAGAQDDLSAQIYTMLDLARGAKLPPSFFVVDKDEIKEYGYRQEGSVRLRTAVGDVDTIVVSSQRKGSPRTLRTWFAPSLGYVPVKAERTRDGKVEFSMVIRNLKR